jgi:CHASE3 domain sensor protein
VKEGTIRLAYAGVVAACAVVAFAAVAAFRNIDQADATADWVNHTHATIYALDRVLGSVVAGDGAARTHVLTGGARELAEARGEFGEMADHLESLKALTRDDPAVSAQVQELENLVTRHAETALARAAARGGRDAASLEQLIASDPGLQTLQEVKRRAARIRAGQFELLDARDRAAYRQTQTTRWVLGTCLVLDVLLLGAVAWLVRDDVATRRRLAETLLAANATLEARVAERTRELQEANRLLTDENLERKWAARSLEHQLRYNQIIVGATSDLAFVVTRNLTITRVNATVMLRTGWPEEEVIGRPLATRLRGIDGATQAVRAGREIPDQPVQLTDQAGRERTGRYSLLLILDNDKVVGGVVLVRLDHAAQT